MFYSIFITYFIKYKQFNVIYTTTYGDINRENNIFSLE